MTGILAVIAANSYLVPSECLQLLLYNACCFTAAAALFGKQYSERIT
jgi:hypothetical protein